MTMYRYIALMWSRTDREAAQAAKFLAEKLHEVSPHAWSQAWEGAGLAIYHSGAHKGRMQTYRLQGEQGAVLGRLFRNDYTSVVDDLDEFESRKCLETRGQRLIDAYWGRYVAFLNDPPNGTRYVMRDPSGAFPCFHTSFRGVTIYFSDMQDVANFDFLPFTVNWEYLKTNILLPQYQKTITGLNEVGEVLPAERLEITPIDEKSRFVWNPTEIAQTDVVEDPEKAAELLRETVMNTVGALAGCYDRIVHNLGGLDSSIVLACMAKAPKPSEITCINFHTKSPRGEERVYSRQVARRAKAPLVEQRLGHEKVELTKIFDSIKLARPLGYFDCIGLTGDVLKLVTEKNAQAIFFGVGGDNVFYQPARNLGALDHIRTKGVRKDTLKIAMEASRYGRKSLAATIRTMALERVSPAPCFEYVHNEMFADYKIPFVNPEFVENVRCEKFLHPLLRPETSFLKGKYLHILISALFSIDYYDHWDTEYRAERIHAFLTQPVVEACLRVPTWVLTFGGIDRGLARKAFQHDLPQDVIKRRTKSTPSEYYQEIYENNINLLREIMLDSILVKKQVLLREQLQNAFDNGDIFLHIMHSQLLGYVGTEAWIRGWIPRQTSNPMTVSTA